MQAPCYNTKTKTDCSNRSITCRASCKAWKEYELYKKEEYANNAIIKKSREAEFDDKTKRDMRIMKIIGRKMYG
ncbi:MAG: hypothetical protein RR490_03475 [Niameybacter sp.]